MSDNIDWSKLKTVEDIVEEEKQRENESAIMARVSEYTAKDGTDAAMIEWLREKFADDPFVSEINDRVAQIKAENPKQI